MSVLVVSRYKEQYAAHVLPFVAEQFASLKDAGCEAELFLLQGNYLTQWKSLCRKIRDFKPDVIHAHYGLSGLLANLQRKIPVVTTYHGSDINDRKALPFSKMAMRLSAWNIFVSRKTLEIASPKKKYSLLPCGIDLSDLQLTKKSEARRRMDLDAKKKYVLFAGAFNNLVKNASLAKKAISLMLDENVVLMELKGYSRDEVTLLMCAANGFLMTSVSEGSPQVIKEAMACGCPIVSVDVGDVRERVEGVDGCFVAQSREPGELSELLRKAISFDGKTNGREKVVADGIDNRQVAEHLIDIYNSII